MTNNTLLSKGEKEATEILQNQLSSDYVYHNYDHTKMIVEAAETIGKAENLTEDQLETVLIAAWFQDTGFRDIYLGHEEKSQAIAKTFLEREKVPAAKIKAVLACLSAIKPDNVLGKVLLDANKIHLTKGGYRKYTENLRQEIATLKKVEYTDTEWLRSSVEFISRYRFHTAYGQEKLNPAKEENRLKLEKRLSKLQKQIDENMITQLGVTTAELKALKKKLQKVEGRPERGIETMFRLTSKNHIELSGMADSKANIMISVNSIIISILLGGLMQKLDSNPHLVIPTIILLIVSLCSMIFSILSLRPNVTNGLFTREDIENQRTNLLFFGNFHKMKRDDYHWGMNQLMDNASFLYSNLIDDIYFLGVVLATKYRYLRISYNIFMVGIIIAVMAYVISIFFAEVPMRDSIPYFVPDSMRDSILNSK